MKIKLSEAIKAIEKATGKRVILEADEKIKNPETGRTIKVSSALSYPKDSAVYKLASKKGKPEDEKKETGAPTKKDEEEGEVSKKLNQKVDKKDKLSTSERNYQNKNCYGWDEKDYKRSISSKETILRDQNWYKEHGWSNYEPSLVKKTEAKLEIEKQILSKIEANPPTEIINPTKQFEELKGKFPIIDKIESAIGEKIGIDTPVSITKNGNTIEVDFSKDLDGIKIPTKKIMVPKGHPLLDFLEKRRLNKKIRVKRYYNKYIPEVNKEVKNIEGLFDLVNTLPEIWGKMNDEAKSNGEKINFSGLYEDLMREKLKPFLSNKNPNKIEFSDSVVKWGKTLEREGQRSFYVGEDKEGNKYRCQTWVEANKDKRTRKISNVVVFDKEKNSWADDYNEKLENLLDSKLKTYRK